MRRVALASLLLIAACGGDDGSGSPPATGSAPPDTTVAATEPETVPAADTTPPATEPVPTEAAADTTPRATQPVPSETAVGTEPTEPTGPERTAFEPIGPGPYEVGVETLTIVDDVRDRELTMDVWFPLEPGTGGDPHRYTLIPGAYYTSPRAVAAPRSAVAEGPFPLVVYSHGAAGLRYIHSNLPEALAANGYIVAAVDHAGDTALDQILGVEVDREQMAFNRVADVRTVVDAMTTPGREDTGGWPQQVDESSIALAGHSVGGFTALAVDAGYENAAGAVGPDDRVDALVLMAPAVGDRGSRTLLGDAALARVEAPVLVMVGTGDTATPADPNVDRVWEHVASPSVYRAELVDARHQTFTDACAYERDVLSLPDVPEPVVQAIEARAGDTCTDDAMPAERAQDLTNTLAVIFLDSVFRGAEMITEDNTEIPDDLLYETR